jgi:methane/phenol/toluene hydroxylase
MTETKPAPRTRARSLKTWSAFGDLGRRPTEYEILTHNLNHTTGAVPLEMGPEVHGNVWLREHRDSMKLTADWDAFRDPDALTYGSYVSGQDDQETYVEGLLEQFDREHYDEALTPPALDLLAAAFTPSRYLAHGLQMLSAYLQQLAVSSYVGNCAAFQTADQLRRVQLTAYRTTQLRLTHTGRSFGSGERDTWENGPDWQPIRRGIESALVEFDWDRALVVTNLVVKPVADLVLLNKLSQQAAAAGAQLDALILDNLWRDARRSQRWTSALVTFLGEADPGNLPVLQGYLDEFAPLGTAITEAAGRLLTVPGGRSAAQISAETRSAWAALLGQMGLTAGPE